MAARCGSPHSAPGRGRRSEASRTTRRRTAPAHYATPGEGSSPPRETREGEDIVGNRGAVRAAQASRPRLRPCCHRLLLIDIFSLGRCVRKRSSLLAFLIALHALGALAGIAADLGNQMDEIDELVRLPAQLVGYHRRLCRDR